MVLIRKKLPLLALGIYSVRFALRVACSSFATMQKSIALVIKLGYLSSLYRHAISQVYIYFTWCLLDVESSNLDD